ncbi:Deoxyhypusine hydroxylase [Aphelenchoides besseyi]|nr:Deoxyhypusine hydroxylase [Aphelenchoides besseyi]KAI6194357.1 Deoxyhypusine hydroxylase [Aphelenchoides besseyi]
MNEVIPEPGSFTTYADGITTDYVDSTGRVLNDQSKPLAVRFRALFVLRNIKCDRSVYWIGKALDDSSALLKHELAYCLGQMQNPAAIPVLTETLKNERQEPMVRHEAGEALGAIGDPRVANILEEYSKDQCPEVAETCMLALARIQWLEDKKNDPGKNSAYDSVDPTPAAEVENVGELGNTLIDMNRSLWERYRAMFALRNLNTPESIKALAQGLYCEDSALFRHEVAYVLGQIQSPLTIKELSDGLRNPNENYMVRHECAEALGSIATEECEELLKEYAKDQERVVRESCEVALDMAEYEKSDAFQYASIAK